MHKHKLAILHYEVTTPQEETQPLIEEKLQFFNREYAQCIHAAPDIDTSKIPSRVRRRMSFLTKMIVSTACKCLENKEYDSETMGIVVASGWGELKTTENLLLSVIEDDVCVSPTKFHNSVHNTAAGYLGIILGAKGPTLTVSQETHSFETALEVASLLIASKQTSMVLVGGADTYFRFSVLERDKEKYPKVFGCGATFFLLQSYEQQVPYFYLLYEGNVTCKEDMSAYVKKILHMYESKDIDVVWLSGVCFEFVELFKEQCKKMLLVINKELAPYPTNGGEDFSRILASLAQGRVCKTQNYSVYGNKDIINKVLYIKSSKSGTCKSFIINGS